MNSGGLGLLTRVSDASHFYQLELSRLGTGTLGWDIYKNDGERWTKLSDGAWNFTSGTNYRLRFTAVGSQLKAEISTDGGTTWTGLGDAYDSSYVSGRVGLRAQGGATGTFDDVVVTKAG